MNRVLRTVLKGAAAGGAATLPMSAVMLAAQKAGLMGEQPPEKITGAALYTTGAKTGEKQLNLAASAAHLGYGVGAGALFSLARRRLKLPGPPVLQGIGYGLALWALSYKGWVPALGIMPPPESDRPGRPTAMIAAHIAFGATLGALVDRW